MSARRLVLLEPFGYWLYGWSAKGRESASFYVDEVVICGFWKSDVHSVSVLR